MIDIQALQQAIKDKLVSVQKHPTADLWIYNYTPKVQYEKLWNDITRQCRGLILDKEYNIVARPFQKFFNLEEHKPEEIPNETFEVFEKMDGSLGILYWNKDKPYIATRGSFVSDQAKVGTMILYSKYLSDVYYLDKTKTYLFEIIYPANRIVIDYGGKSDLILLAVIDNVTGKDCPIEGLKFPTVRKHAGGELHLLKSLQKDNEEGFVVRFKNGFRVKVKFDEYIRLHRIVTGISTKVVWEYMKSGQSFNELLDRVPDEFYKWVMSVKDVLWEEYTGIDYRTAMDFENCLDKGEDGEFVKPKRKAFAEKAARSEYKGILFKMYDGKPYGQIIWRIIKPKYSKPFKEEI